MATDLLQVSELFFSIQGESRWAGYPCVFIRLTGCNLRCSFCDARYTYEEPGEPMSCQDICRFVDQYPHALIEVTGGEPLIQEATIDLCSKLLHKGRTVLLETNGSIDLEKVPHQVIKIVDLKTPGSGMHQAMRKKHFRRLDAQDEIKCVVADKKDYTWAKSFLFSLDLLSAAAAAEQPAITFSPVTGALDPAELALWLLEDNLPARMQIQLHTILWPTQKRGV